MSQLQTPFKVGPIGYTETSQSTNLFRVTSQKSADVGLYLHTSLPSALDAGEWSASRSGSLIPVPIYSQVASSRTLHTAAGSLYQLSYLQFTEICGVVSEIRCERERICTAAGIRLEHSGRLSERRSEPFALGLSVTARCMYRAAVPATVH